MRRPSPARLHGPSIDPPIEGTAMQLARSRRASRLGATFLAVVTLAPLHQAVGQADPEVLSNNTVVQMVAGKLSKDLIIGKINSARPGFDLSSDGITSLVTMK